ncbi:uncharacterized protein FIBRA_06265 [Fibroporia radiculosa]|uniref:Protein kinase domain-containing protein n=1 Tax=Fibroporia radiculosa TaxID=599839 RepID=J4GSF6_9APHY|nr:uncharacterized protein FIBRA_06265 [Fibroporia radiculosa]CCM04105.1 predicted protein [Fibroporia radiculosa]
MSVLEKPSVEQLSGTFTITNCRHENRAILPNNNYEVGLVCIVPPTVGSIEKEEMWTLAPSLGGRYTIKNCRYNFVCAAPAPIRADTSVMGMEKSPFQWWILDKVDTGLYGPNAYMSHKMLSEEGSMLESGRRGGLLTETGSIPKFSHIPTAELHRGLSRPVMTSGTVEVQLGHYNNKDVALKILRDGYNDHSKVRKVLVREAACWRHLSHPNIVPFLGIEETYPQLCLVSAWMHNGNMNAYLKAYPRSNRYTLLLEVVQGLKYLHSLHIVHGGLSGSGILIDKDWHARLFGFGLMDIVDDSDQVSSVSCSSLRESLRWLAPELIWKLSDDIWRSRDEASEAEFFDRKGTARPSYASDVYAFSMVMYEVFSGNIPFYDQKSDGGVVRTIMSGGYPAFEETWTSRLPDSMLDLMKECWATKPAERPSLQGVLEDIQLAELNKVQDEPVLGHVAHVR